MSPNKIKNLKMQNLCTTLTPPPNIIRLLGLNLKFCIEKSNPKDETEKSFTEFLKSCRTHWLFLGEETGEYNPKLYLKSKIFDPEPVRKCIEQRILDFHDEIKNLVTNNKTKPRSNLTQ